MYSVELRTWCSTSPQWILAVLVKMMVVIMMIPWVPGLAFPSWFFFPINMTWQKQQRDRVREALEANVNWFEVDGLIANRCGKSYPLLAWCLPSNHDFYRDKLVSWKKPWTVSLVLNFNSSSLIKVKHLKQCLVHRKHSINVSVIAGHYHSFIYSFLHPTHIWWEPTSCQFPW